MHKVEAKDEERIKTLLKSIADSFDKEDRATRERQIRHCQRLKLYWNNMSRIYWDEGARDYRIAAAQDLSTDNDQSYYDRPINVFRALLETVIAALSIQIPGVSCIPDDADSPLDISTAKAGNKIAELTYKHNNAVFLWLHALYVYATEGMIACYTYAKEDESYGTYKTKKFEDEEVEAYACSFCGEQVADEVFSDNVMDEFAPDDDDAALHDVIKIDGPLCPSCGELLDPNLQKSKLTIPRFVGMIDKPKARICMEVYGGLYIKIANYAKKQEDTPYLIWSFETHYANAIEMYPDIRDQLLRGGRTIGTVNDPYEQQGRLNPQYRGEFPIDNVTVKYSWLRPAAFNTVNEEDTELLKKHFPDGAKVVIVNDICADYENEALDDCWTLTRNPMSDYLTHEPLGELLTNIQDIVNDLISLTIQCIEHGVSQVWADPAVVNFNAQSQLEIIPGVITQTKPASGKNISDAFYSTNAATLNPEVFKFYQIVQELGQFVSGALPSLFGGQQGSGSSRTASEYAMQKGMALQRLQTPWKMMTIWWKEIFGKVIPAYMKEVQDDIRFVEKSDQGRYVNVFIRKSELGGKIGDIELEGADQLPITEDQKRELIIQLMQLNNEEILKAMSSPENLPSIRKVVRMPEFRLPGEDDRQKQYEEIDLLLQSQPVVQPPDEMQIAEAMATGMPPQPIELPSIGIDPDVDNHAIESDICRSWAVSEAGRLAKVENPKGYQNVLLHMKMHLQVLRDQLAQQMMAQQAQNQEQSQGKSNQLPKGKDTDREIKGEGDVIQPIR